MRRQTDFVWEEAVRSQWPIRWLVLLAVVVMAVVYVSVGTFDDPVVAIAPPQAIELPTKKPEPDPVAIERIHILNPTPERREAAQSVTSEGNDAATYDDLRRELLTGE
jgi:hypothetical protein